MGYTHYFAGLGCTKKLVEFAFDAEDATRVNICGPLGYGHPKLSLNPPKIELNGARCDDEDCEGFILPATEAGDGYCKTARAPYDEVVVAILIAAMVLNIKETENIGSDGCYEDWDKSGGVDLFLKTYEFDRQRPVPKYARADRPIEKANLAKALSWRLDNGPDVYTGFDAFCHKLFPKRAAETPKSKEKLLVRYHSDQLEHLQYIGGEKSDWIDLRAAEDVSLKQGEFKLISLGISVKIPKGYEMVIVPRSSTFKNFGILQTNSFGVIDESYCGDNDILRFPALAMRDTEIHVNDRICQFRIQKHQPSLEILEVEHLDGKDRGGFGSTGKN